MLSYVESYCRTLYLNVLSLSKTMQLMPLSFISWKFKSLMLFTLIWGISMDGCNIACIAFLIPGRLIAWLTEYFDKLIDSVAINNDIVTPNRNCRRPKWRIINRLRELRGTLLTAQCCFKGLLSSLCLKYWALQLRFVLFPAPWRQTAAISEGQRCEIAFIIQTSNSTQTLVVQRIGVTGRSLLWPAAGLVWMSESLLSFERGSAVLAHYFTFTQHITVFHKRFMYIKLR